MVTILHNHQAIQLPEGWHDVPFMRYYNAQKSLPANDSKLQFTADILGIELDMFLELLNSPILFQVYPDFREKHMDWVASALIQDVLAQPISSFELDGETYSFAGSVGNMSFQKLIEYDMYMNGDDRLFNIPVALVILCQKQGETYADLCANESKLFYERIKLFREKLSIATVMGFHAFFLTLTVGFGNTIENILKPLIPKMVRIKAESEAILRDIQDLTKTGGGSESFTISAVTTSLKRNISSMNLYLPSFHG